MSPKIICEWMSMMCDTPEYQEIKMSKTEFANWAALAWGITEIAAKEKGVSI
ncbi:MAG: hypothetical protein KAV87_66295 [Desulfobacteraceae bacterium]|nr:hypothetical protein [Desulfobacteraceae bacterium]